MLVATILVIGFGCVVFAVEAKRKVSKRDILNRV